MAKPIEQQMAKFFALMDSETITQKDFEAAFAKVIDLVQQILRKQEEFERRLDGTNQQFQTVTKSELNKAISDLKTQTNQLFVESRLKDMSAEQKALFNSLKNNVSSLLDMKVSEMQKEIAQRAVPGPQGRPPTKSEIQFSVANMIGESKKELEELKEEIKKELERFRDARSNKSMGRAKIQIIRAVDLTSQVDGSVTTFTMPRDTINVLFVYSTQFPTILRPTTDFTFAGTTLTLTGQVGTIQSGQTLTALAEVLFYP